MVLNVAQIRPRLLADLRLVDQARKDVVQRARRALELDHFSYQLIDATGNGGAATEYLVLDLVDVVLEAGDDRLIAVDDVVDDRVSDRHRPPPQHVRARLAPPTYPPQLRRIAMADGDHELRANEDRDLAKHDRLRLVHVAGMSQDDEQRVSVTLQLRPMMRFDSVLDGELVQVELARDRRELLLARLEKTQPGNRVAALAGGVELGKGVGPRRPSAVAIDTTVDDHSKTVSPLLTHSAGAASIPGGMPSLSSGPGNTRAVLNRRRRHTLGRTIASTPDR